MEFKARHKLILTGTPIENSLEELWSLFDFLMPGLLSTFERFRGMTEHEHRVAAERTVAKPRDHLRAGALEAGLREGSAGMVRHK